MFATSLNRVFLGVRRRSCLSVNSLIKPVSLTFSNHDMVKCPHQHVLLRTPFYTIILSHDLRHSSKTLLRFIRIIPHHPYHHNASHHIVIINTTIIASSSKSSSNSPNNGSRRDSFVIAKWQLMLKILKLYLKSY